VFQANAAETGGVCKGFFGWLFSVPRFGVKIPGHNQATVGVQNNAGAYLGVAVVMTRA
jgi:hypothetical protein